MPLVQVKLIEGVFTETQKREMLRKLTDAMISIEGENMRSVTHVFIEEVKSGDWAVGGNALTTADVKAIAEGKQPGKKGRTEPDSGLVRSREGLNSSFAPRPA